MCRAIFSLKKGIDKYMLRLPVRRSIVGLTVLTALVLLGQNSGFAQQTSGTDKTGGNHVAYVTGPDSAEKTLRNFLLAMMEGDKQMIRSLIVPVKDEEFHYLIDSELMPLADRIPAEEAFKVVPIKVLKPGDTVQSNRRSWTVTKSDVNADTALLMMERAPMPMRLLKKKGKWLMDATPLINGRKAARTVAAAKNTKH